MNKIGSRTKRNLEGLSVEMGLVVGMALARGRVDFTVINGLRTTKEQQDNYAIGRTKPGKKITWKDGVNKKSYHQIKMAIDTIPYPFDNDWYNEKQFKDVWEELAYCARFLGFEPGPYLKWDSGHFELRSGLDGKIIRL